MPIYALLALIQEPTPGGAPATTTPNPDAGAAGGPSSLLSILPYVAIIAIFYFVMIMPERKARKKREAMLAAMKKGDRVMTSSGMFAVVAAIDTDEITLQIADGVRARFSRQAITQVLGDPTPETKK